MFSLLLKDLISDFSFSIHPLRRRLTTEELQVHILILVNIEINIRNCERPEKAKLI